MMRPWFEKYVGLPFVDGGRDFNGVDCWGLVRLVLRTECGIEVPSYGETSAIDLAAVAGIVAHESALDPWLPVNGNVRPFDVAVMYRRHAPIHVGIMATDRLLLHVEAKILTALVDLHSPHIRFRYPKLFRHKDLIRAAA
jgi:cell wall-associated NlpC family hydrolase